MALTTPDVAFARFIAGIMMHVAMTNELKEGLTKIKFTLNHEWRFSHPYIAVYCGLLQEWHAGFLEDCPDGELTKAQFVDMYTKIFPGGNAEKFSENVFRTFDTDRSGTIDFRRIMQN